MTNHPNRRRVLPPFAAALKAYRAREGERRGLGRALYQRDLAEEIDVDPSVVRDWEQAGTSPQTSLARLATMLLEKS